MERLRHVLRWLRSPTPTRVPNAKCSLCGQPVVIEPTTYGGSRFSGPMYAPPTPQEKTAACAVHGRPPFNDATLAYERGGS